MQKTRALLKCLLNELGGKENMAAMKEDKKIRYNTEQGTLNGQTTIEASLNMDFSDEELEKLAAVQDQGRYPIWDAAPNDKIKGIVLGFVGLPHLNDGAGGIILNIQTEAPNTPFLSVWMTSVLYSQFYKLVEHTEDFREDDFDTKISVLRESEMKRIGIIYLGEVKGSKKGYRPYKNYKVVELTPL
jgi:hypothetical protein